MGKKELIISRMQEELEQALESNVEPVTGESYMTLQYVYSMLKTSFEKTFIPEHILDIFMLQEFPLSKFYDYFIDHDYFKKVVNWDTISREYAIYRECEFVEEQFHDKVEKEYKDFMKTVIDLAPYQMGQLISEISFKMQVFSIFRYQDCFSVEDMKVLQGVEGVLDKAYGKYRGEYLTPADEHYLWATTMDCLGKIVEEERSEEDEYESALEA